MIAAPSSPASTVRPWADRAGRAGGRGDHALRLGTSVHSYQRDRGHAAGSAQQLAAGIAVDGGRAAAPAAHAVRARGGRPLPRRAEPAQPTERGGGAARYGAADARRWRNSGHGAAGLRRAPGADPVRVPALSGLGGSRPGRLRRRAWRADAAVRRGGARFHAAAVRVWTAAAGAAGHGAGLLGRRFPTLSGWAGRAP